MYLILNEHCHAFDQLKNSLIIYCKTPSELVFSDWVSSADTFWLNTALFTLFLYNVCQSVNLSTPEDV